MPYKDKEKQKEAQRLWAQKQSSEFKQIKYEREYANKKLVVQKAHTFRRNVAHTKLYEHSTQPDARRDANFF